MLLIPFQVVFVENSDIVMQNIGLYESNKTQKTQSVVQSLQMPTTVTIATQ